MTASPASRVPRVLLMGDTRIVGHHGSSSVVKVILREMGERGLEVVSTGAAGFRYDPAAAGAADSIVMNAEGALHGRNPNALRIAACALQAKAAGLPCFVLNAVVDECHEDVAAGLRAATAVFCRESRSYERALAYGAAAVLCPDLTFALPMCDVAAWTPGDRVVVTDSTLDKANRALHALARRAHAQFLPLRGRPDVPLLSSRKAFVRILKFSLRHRLGRMAPGSFAADRFGCAVSTPQACMDALARDVRLVVAGRYHAVCLCMKLGAPFVAIRSNTYKVEGMLEDAGLAHRLVDRTELEALADLRAFADRRPWTREDAARSARYVEAAQPAIAACFDRVADSARARRSAC